MRESVRKAAGPFNTAHEARLRFMYLCTAELVTTGIGNMIDGTGNPALKAAPWSPALALPWRRPDGTPATIAEVKAAWLAVKAEKALAQKGGGNFGHITSLRLSEEAVDALVASKLAEVGRQLKKRFPTFDEMPADAGLALVSMAWAMGEARFAQFPKFSAFIRAGDYHGAAGECLMQPNKGSLRDRNKANAVMLKNAAYVAAEGMDCSVLHYPRDLDPVSVA